MEQSGMDRYMRIAIVVAAVGGFGLGAATTQAGGNWLVEGIEGAAEMVASILVFYAWRAFKGR